MVDDKQTWLFDIVNGQGDRQGFTPFRPLQPASRRNLRAAGHWGIAPEIITMTDTSRTSSLSVQFRVDITGRARKPKAKGKPFFKLALLSLLVFAALFSIGTAVVVNGANVFNIVYTVWNEINPVLVLLLLFLLKQRS